MMFPELVGAALFARGYEEARGKRKDSRNHKGRSDSPLWLWTFLYRSPPRLGVSAVKKTKRGRNPSGPSQLRVSS